MASSCCVYIALALELQVSHQPSLSISQQCDTSQFLTVWNSSAAASIWPRLPDRDDASKLKDDGVKLDGAVVYSTDPDHEPEEEEDGAADEPAAESEKVLQIALASTHCC